MKGRGCGIFIIGSDAGLVDNSKFLNNVGFASVAICILGSETFVLSNNIY